MEVRWKTSVSCSLQSVFNTHMTSDSSSWDRTAIQTHWLLRDSSYSRSPPASDRVCFGFLGRAASRTQASSAHAALWVYGQRQLGRRFVKATVVLRKNEHRLRHSLTSKMGTRRKQTLNP